MVYEEFVTEIADRLRRSFPDAVSIQLLRLPRNNGHPREALCIREADHSSSPATEIKHIKVSVTRKMRKDGNRR